MRFLRDTSISIKVLIPPTVLILALGLVSLLAIYGLNEQRVALSTVNDIALDKITLIDEFIFLSEQVQSDVFRISVLHFTSVPEEEIQPVQARLEQGLSAMNVIYGQILTKWSLDPTERSILERMREPLDAFGLQAQQAAVVVSDDPSFGALLVRSSAVPFAEFRETLTEFRDYQQARIIRVEAESNQRANTVNIVITIVTSLIALAGIVVTVLIGTRGISHPIRSITDLMRRLAAGDLSIEVGELERRDEIGAMARAVEVFRNNAIEKAQAEEALQKLAHDLGGRVKELNCLYGISALVEQPGISLAEILHGAVELIPPAWQYPEITGARIALEGQTFRTENFQETAWRQASDIVVQGKRIGTLEVCYLEEKPAGDEGPFMKEERALLTAIAARLGRIIARVRAEEALHRRMEELAVLHAIAVAGAEAASLDALIERATEIIGGILYPDNFGVGLVDETAGVLCIHPSYRGLREELRGLTLPLDQGIVGQVVTTGQPCRVSNVTRESACLDLNAGMRSELCVPLKVGERVIGVINAESRHLDAFSEDDQRLMMTFAGQLATAIEKVRLFEAEHRRAQEAETLRQAGAAVAATLQQDEAIERILQELARVVPYDSAAVQLLREGYVENVGGRGWPDPAAVVGLRFPVPGDNPNTIVVQQRQPHILADAPATYAGFREEPHTRIRSWLGVPLIVRDQVTGMLTLDSERPDHFTPAHARLVAAFADQVAIAIENAQLFREVEQLAITDPLTGLYNRRHFFELAEREFKHARRYARPLSALMLDVDRFKQVNDAYGHAAGDQVLRAVARRCQKGLRSTDVLGRYGGEEFAILLPETDLTSAQAVAEKLRQRLAEPVTVNGRTRAMITASIGVGPLDEQCVNLDVLLRRADEALYAAKQAGRNCVRVWQN